MEVQRLFFEWLSVKTIVLVRVYYQQILGNVMFMVFEFQGLESMGSLSWDEMANGYRYPKMMLHLN